MIHAGKDIKDFTLEQLEATLKSMEVAEAKRIEAGKHPKFNIDRTRGTKKIPKMEFPPTNPNFLKLKIEIQEEIGKRNVAEI